MMYKVSARPLHMRLEIEHQTQVYQQQISVRFMWPVRKESLETTTAWTVGISHCHINYDNIAMLVQKKKFQVGQKKFHQVNE